MQDPNNVESTPAAPAAPKASTLGLRVLIVATGLLAAVLAWRIGETDLIRVPARQVPMVTMGVKHMGTTPATEREAVVMTTTRNRIALGALLGLALGAAGGLVGRPRSAAVQGAVVGAVLGGIAAGAVAYPATRYYAAKVESFEDDMIPAMLFHAAIAAAIGAAAGAAAGVGAGGGFGRRAKWVAGGAVGGILGAVLGQVAGGFLLPIDGTADPVAASATARFLAAVAVAAGCCLGVATTTDPA